MIAIYVVIFVNYCHCNQALLIGSPPLKEASEQGSLLVISTIFMAYLCFALIYLCVKLLCFGFKYITIPHHVFFPRPLIL